MNIVAMALNAPTGTWSSCLAALALLWSSGTCTATPVARETCACHDSCRQGTVSTPLAMDLAQVMALLCDSVHEIAFSAFNLQQYLTTPGAGSTPRVSSFEVQDCKLASFLHNLSNVTNRYPRGNVARAWMVISGYIDLTMLYIFYEQALDNAHCDTRPDSNYLEDKMASILKKIRLALADMDFFLTASGHSMPCHLIPNKTEALERATPSLKVIGESYCEEDRSNLRNQVDYVLARDTQIFSDALLARYRELHHTLDIESR